MGFNISGLGSGIDWNLYIDATIKAEQEKLARTLGRQEIKATATQTVFSNLRGAMQSLSNAVNDFTFAGDFKVKNVSSSKPEVVTASATLGATLQSIQVEVVQMSTLEQHRLAFSSKDAVVTNADTTITITVRGEPHEIEVPGGTTFSELSALISSSNIGVSVSVYDSGDGSDTPVRMTIQDRKLGKFAEDDQVEEESGESAANITFDISGLDQVNTSFVNTVEAKDTIVKVNGEEVRRDGHSIDSVIPGVTFQVLKEDPGNPVTLTVTESTNNAAEKIDKLVQAFNGVVAGLKQALRFDPNLEEQTNPTAGNSTLRGILTRLQSTFTSPVSTLPDDKTIRTLADLGVETQFSEGDSAQNGQLKFDKAKFEAALDEKYDDVIAFFEGVLSEGGKLEGFADKASSLMESFLNSTDGVITTKITGLQEEISDINDQKMRKLELLASKEETLVLKYSRLETQLARLNGQQSQLASAIQSLNLNNTFISNRSK